MSCRTPRAFMNAEQAYLFRHAVLREAAYELWLPSDRGRLHAHALDISEQLFSDELDRVAGELAEHSHQAQQGRDEASEATLLCVLREKELAHLWRARKAASRRHQTERVLEYGRRLLASPVLAPSDALMVECEQAESLHQLGRLQQAQAHFRHALQAAQAGENLSFTSRCLLGLARIAGQMGRRLEVEALLEQAMQAARQCNDLGLQAQVTTWLAGSHEDAGRGHLCEELHLRSAELARAAGNEPLRLSALGNLANHYRQCGRLEESAHTMQSVLEGFEALGNAHNVAIALNNMGRTLFLLGRIEQAGASYLRALEIVKPMGPVFSGAFANGNLAEIWILQGRIEEAQSSLLQAIALCDEFAAAGHGAAFRARLAALHLLLGESDAAQERIEESRAGFIACGQEQFIADYCEIVRLRIAADAASGAGARTGRIPGGSVPGASWLPVIRQILANMKQAHASQTSKALELERNIEIGEAVISELDAALREGRPACLWHGFSPSELPQALRAALLNRAKNSLDESNHLQEHAALREAMQRG